MVLVAGGAPARAGGNVAAAWSMTAGVDANGYEGHPTTASSWAEKYTPGER
jgi:hypothetical protein